MTDPPWEIEALSLAISLAWGDTALHTAHLSPPRSFTLGDATADCVLPDSVVGSGRVPLILAEGDALYLVLLPAMDPEGTITAPKQRPRTVADLARPGISEPCPDIPGAFLVKLTPGTTAALSFDGITITITLETKAACAIAGHYHVGKRIFPFQIASAALHLAAIGVAALFLPSFPRDPHDPLSDEQILFIQQALERVDEKEEAALAEIEGPVDDAEGRRFPHLYPSTPRYYSPSFSMYEAVAYGNLDSPSPKPRGPALIPNHDPFPDNDPVGEHEANPPIDPRDNRRSTLDVKVDTAPYAEARRSLLNGEIPDALTIRPEAFLNSFDYHYAGPARGAEVPFAVHLDAAPSPFEAGHHLLRVGVQSLRAADGGRAILDEHPTIQVEFTPDVVQSYRLLGCESHTRRHRDPREAEAPGGGFAAGHSVTAVYDVVLGTTTSSPVTVRLGHRRAFGRGAPWGSAFTMNPSTIAPTWARARPGLRLAVAAVGFAEVLRKNPYSPGWSLAEVEKIAVNVATEDDQAHELVSLIRAARSLVDAPPPRAWSGRVADASLMGF